MGVQTVFVCIYENASERHSFSTLLPVRMDRRLLDKELPSNIKETGT